MLSNETGELVMNRSNMDQELDVGIHVTVLAHKEVAVRTLEHRGVLLIIKEHLCHLLLEVIDIMIASDSIHRVGIAHQTT